MTAPAGTDTPPTDKLLRLRIIMGWLLLAGFAFYVSWSGSIASSVRGFQIAYVAGFVGYLLLLVTVTAGVPDARLGRWRWWLIGCVLLRVPLLHVTPGDDTYRYLWEGRVQQAGFDPYTIAPDDPRLESLRDDHWNQINHPSYPAIYPPIALWEFRLAAIVYPSIHTLKWLHVLWDALTIMVLGGCLQAVGRRPHLAGLYGLCPLVLSAFAIEGHLDSLMLLAISVGLWSLLTGRAIIAGAALGLAVGAKIMAVVLLPWLLFHRPRALIAALIVIGLTHALYPSFAFNGLATLTRFAGDAQFFSVALVLELPVSSEWFRPASAAVLGVIILALSRWQKDPVKFIQSALGVLLLLLPVVHYWYFAWLLVPMSLGHRLRWRWLLGSLAMVVYFEAQAAYAATGAWSMPERAPLVVWSAVALGWALELVLAAWKARLRDDRGSSVK